jgi:hypothetical protein
MIIHHENTSFADTVIDNANTRSWNRKELFFFSCPTWIKN